jgi:ADP-heptose:LPS heptosyltransferase
MAIGWLKRVELAGKALLNAASKLIIRPTKTPLDRSRVRSVLVLRYDRLGDLVISLPVISAIRKHLPNARVGVLCTPRNVRLIAGTRFADDLYVYDKKRPWISIPRLVREIRPVGYDLVLDLIDRPSLTAGLLMSALAPRSHRITMGAGQNAHFYTHTLPRDERDEVHMVERTVAVLEPVGIRVEGEDLRPSIPVTDDDRALADRFSRELLDGFRIGYNLSAGDPERTYPLGSMIELARRVCAKRPDTVSLVFAAPSDLAVAERFVDEVSNSFLAPPREHWFCPVRTIAVFVGLCDAVVSPDTAMVHLAYSASVPTVALYTELGGRPLAWRPFMVSSRTVWTEGRVPLSEIPVAEVYDALISLMDELENGGQYDTDRST